MKQLPYKLLTLFFFSFFLSLNINAQFDPSVLIDFESTEKGILVPRMTTIQKDAITSPATGLLIYDTTLKTFCYYNGAEWVKLEPGSGHNTLDEAYDQGNPGNGRIITADNGAVEVNGTGANDAVTVTNSGDKNGIMATQSGGGNALDVNHSGTGNGLDVYHTSSGDGIYVAKEDNSTGRGIEVWHRGTGSAVKLRKELVGEGDALEIIQDRGDDGAQITTSDGGHGANIIQSDDGNGINMTHDGDGDGISITHSSTGDGLNINQTGTGNGAIITHLATGIGLQASNTAAGANHENIMEVTQNGQGNNTLNDPNGRAAVFKSTQANNVRPVVEALHTGKGPGVHGKTGSAAGAAPMAGVSGSGFTGDDNDPRMGVAGSSDKDNGVWGATAKGGTWASSASPSDIKAGVHGTLNFGGSEDYFAVAGIAGGYQGTGVLGVGEGERGHGVIGITGPDPATTRSVAGVWGLTREEAWGAFKTRYPLSDGPPAMSTKNQVAVLGQAKAKVAIWGESQEYIGSVSTTGGKLGLADIPGGIVAGAFTMAVQPGAFGIYSMAIDPMGTSGHFSKPGPGMGGLSTLAELSNSDGIAGLFRSLDESLTDPTILAEHFGLGPVIDARSHHEMTGGLAIFESMHPMNSATTFTVLNRGVGQVAYIETDNPANDTDVLIGKTVGTGSAGVFEVDNVASATSALIGLSNAVGAGIEAKNTTTGRSLLATKPGGSSGHVAEFVNSSPTNPTDGVRIASNATGSYACNIINTSTTIGFPKMALRVDGETELHGLSKVFGDLDVTGIITGAAKLFRIDHPLEPTEKYLCHMSIESSEMMNIYTGNVELDENGNATVLLPDWMEATNTDFRYQLTCIGGYAPVYIAEEVSNNQFSIAGGKPGLKVSWEISATRHDPFAKAQKFEPVVNKPTDKVGTYVHPEAYGIEEN